jgi:hypothetical protein
MSSAERWRSRSRRLYSLGSESQSSAAWPLRGERLYPSAGRFEEEEQEEGAYLLGSPSSDWRDRRILWTL